MSATNSTVLPDDGQSTGSMVIGYVVLLISCTSFGTMFTPLKRRDTKDGFFVQWVECSVVLCVGFVINIIRGFPPFEWVAAIGGVLYATGNVLCVPIVNGLGMGIGFLIWGSMQIIVGWSVARFGLFGWLAATHVKHNLLNYVGMVITLISGVLFIFVKHGNHESKPTISYDGDQDMNLNLEAPPSPPPYNSMKPAIDKAELLRKIPYILMTCVLAILHGLMMTPISILEQRHPSHDEYKVFDYIWSFYSTVFFFSTIYFFLYCLVRREKAYVDRQLVIPAALYGLLWSSGMTFWFVSSHKLSQVVAYPITTRLPAIISASVDVLIFKSITGRSNLLFLTGAIGVGIVGVVLIALSNQSF
ncbi:hypothetical protein NECAME_00516 [Necator americanus]|uniref:Transmembrane protein 144 n=1 Tax=Necator americanus TaxID=51031 RepID=W2T4N4_NECAM|nr:hypothetical protein NECAME_00516 [Necator americanus]ETN76990.1 hypothetical protein NECAME_00516 [Necator americanus]